MEPIKVSILVPVYGVEKYIERCAISLFEQTYLNIEYVFVNDCTKDKSIDILKSVVEKYPQRKKQMRIIEHECNRGLAAARNTAVQAATGDFIMHVDSDDWLEIQAVEMCIQKQKENDADIVTMDAMVWWSHKKEYYRTPHTTQPIQLMIAVLSKKAVCNIWGRLIRRNLYTDNQIQVKEGLNFSEDLQVVPQLLYFSKSINYCSDLLYNYESRNINSYTTGFSETNDLQRQQSTNILRCFFDAKDKKYLKYIDLLEVANLILSIKGCMKYKGHDEYYNKLIRKRIVLDKKLYYQIPLYDRLVLFIKNKYILKTYIKLASFAKKFI